MIFGGGHDAVPLVVMAKQLGWQVVVADARPAYARPERFPAADRVVLLRHESLESIGIGRESVVVLMTHSFLEDARLLDEILPAEPRYVGLLGPADRAERLFAQIGVDGARLPFVRAPVGLDIGGDGPDAIALSIVAEVQAVLAGRSGGVLKRRRGPMHAPIEELGRDVQLPWPRSEAHVCDVGAGVV